MPIPGSEMGGGEARLQVLKPDLPSFVDELGGQSRRSLFYLTKLNLTHKRTSRLPLG